MAEEALREQQHQERIQQREAERLQRQKAREEERRAREMDRDARLPQRRKVRRVISDQPRCNFSFIELVACSC